jgi:hypothetical protein
VEREIAVDVIGLAYRTNSTPITALEVKMVTLNRITTMLDEQHRELLGRLDAIEKAIAALNGAGIAVAETRPAEPDVPAEQAASVVVPRRVRPKRVLSDSHKQALVLSNRKARNAKEAAKGLAREMPGDSFVPAIAKRGDRQPPRLVKRPVKK